MSVLSMGLMSFLCPTYPGECEETAGLLRKCGSRTRVRSRDCTWWLRGDYFAGSYFVLFILGDMVGESILVVCFSERERLLCPNEV